MPEQFPVLKLPVYDYKLKRQNQTLFIFDPFRRKYVVLTPEEWVRQHFLHWLVKDLNYPATRIVLEAQLKYFKLQKRADAVVYDKWGSPAMIIECKASHIAVSQEVFDQAVRYNLPSGAPYIALTNGLEHVCLRYDARSGEWCALDVFPAWNLIEG